MEKTLLTRDKKNIEKNTKESTNCKEISKKMELNYTYSATQIIGSGSFGVVYQATICRNWGSCSN